MSETGLDTWVPAVSLSYDNNNRKEDDFAFLKKEDMATAKAVEPVVLRTDSGKHNMRWTAENNPFDPKYAKMDEDLYSLEPDEEVPVYAAPRKNQSQPAPQLPEREYRKSVREGAAPSPTNPFASTDLNESDSPVRPLVNPFDGEASPGDVIVFVQDNPGVQVRDIPLFMNNMYGDGTETETETETAGPLHSPAPLLSGATPSAGPGPLFTRNAPQSLADIPWSPGPQTQREDLLEDAINLTRDMAGTSSAAKPLHDTSFFETTEM